MGVPETIGSDAPNLMKDVPNFMKDVPSIPKCIPRLGSTPNHFLMGSKMKSWTNHVQMGVPKTIKSGDNGLWWQERKKNEKRKRWKRGKW